MSTPNMEQITNALMAARGCDCCASYDEALALWPDSCPRDEWGIDHQYDDGCGKNFYAVIRRALQAAKEATP